MILNKVKNACECKDKKKESKIDVSMEDIEARRERVEKIQSMFSDIHYKTQEVKDANILSLTKANLTIEEIEQIISSLRPDYMKSKDEQVHRKGVY